MNRPQAASAEEQEDRMEIKKEREAKGAEEKRKHRFLEGKRKGRQGQTSDFTGVASNPLEAFSVRPPPASMNKLVLDFSALDEAQEDMFLQVYFQIKKKYLGTEWEVNQLRNFILLGQKFVREAEIFRVHVSIRDMMRAVKLYSYFRHKKPFLHRKVPQEYFQDQEHYRHWQALLLSISMAYYFRLRVRSEEEKFDEDFYGDDRESFANNMVMHLIATQDRHQVRARGFL